MVRKSVASIYNPSTLAKEKFLDSFVVRIPKFERIFKDIKEADMSVPQQHYLLEGQRGMGKTSFLLKLAYSIEDDPDLNSFMVPVVFNEEEYSISRLFKLWEKVAELLEENGFPELFDDMDDLYEKLDDDELYEKAAFELLVDQVKKAGKKLVLFIDNFGDIFSKFNKHENQRLREVLTTCAEIRLIAASSVVMETFFAYKEPLFEFFKRERLGGLSKAEAERLLLKLGEEYHSYAVKKILKEQPGRLEALRRLSGGVIRTIVLLFEIFSDYENGDAFKDLEKVLDAVTPLYKHRMDDLPSQQQSIVNAIALGWDATSTKEIAKKTKLASKVVSAQIKQLIDNDIVEKVPTHTKNHLYRMKERFFNIWYLMRQGRRNDKRRVIWLTRFFEGWCDEVAIVDRVGKHIHAIKGEGLDPEYVYFLSSALCSVTNIRRQSKVSLIAETLQDLSLRSKELFHSFSSHEFNLEMDPYDFLDIASNLYQRDPLIIHKIFPDVNYSVLYFTLGRHSLYKKDFIIGIKLMEEAVNLGNEVAFLVCAHHFLFKEPNPEKLLSLAKMALENKFFDVAFSIGVRLQENGELEKSNKIYDILASNGDWIGYFHLVEAEYSSDIESYRKPFERLLKLGFSSPHQVLERLFQFQKRINHKCAALQVESLTVFSPKNFAPFNKWADMFSKMGFSLKADSILIKSIQKYDSDHSKNNLGWIYFSEKRKKNDALNFVKKIKPANLSPLFSHTIACIQAWNDKNSESIVSAEKFLQDRKFVDQFSIDVELYFILLIAKKQYSPLHTLFTSPQGEELHLKDRFKPIWYALMYHMQDEYPIEYLKMGPELEETVQEIVAKAEQMAIDYA